MSLGGCHSQFSDCKECPILTSRTSSATKSPIENNITPWPNGYLIRLKSLRENDEALLFRIYTIENQPLTALLISMLFEKNEHRVDTFNLYGESEVNDLYRHDACFNLKNILLMKTRDNDSRTKACSLSHIESEKRLLKYIRFCKGSVPLDSITFSSDAIKNQDKLLSMFDSISGEQLFTSKTQSKDKFRLPVWFAGTGVASIASWIVAHFEARIMELYFKDKTSKNIQLELPSKTTEKILKAWMTCSEQEKERLFDKVINSIDHFSSACFCKTDESKHKRTSFSPEERSFFHLLNLSGMIETPKPKIKDIIKARLLKKKSVEGDKLFIVNSLCIGSKDCYNIESFFCNLLCASLVDLAAQQLLSELQRESLSKKSALNKSKSKQISKPNSCEQKILEQPEDKSNHESSNEQEETNEEGSVEPLKCLKSKMEAMHITESSLQPTNSPPTPKLSVNPDIYSLPKKKPSVTWNSDEEFIEESQPKFKSKQTKHATHKRPKLIKDTLPKKFEEPRSSKPEPLKKTQPPTLKRKSAPNYPAVAKTWDEEDLAERIQQVNAAKTNSLRQKFLSKKNKCEVESYVDREKLLSDIVTDKIDRQLSLDIERISSSIKSFADSTKDIRRIVKSRIEYVLNKTSHGQFKLEEYGSCSTGLLTPFSDMDLAIETGSHISDKSKAIEFLHLLFGNLAMCSFVIDAKEILTATVPVIKLEASAQVPFESLECTESTINVKVDIIVKTKEYFDIEHTSTRTTSYVQNACDTYPTFFKNMITLKYSLHCSDLMNSYKGGLNSYGLALLYVAFLLLYKQEGEKNLGKTFRNFLSFVCYEFDPLTHAINLNSYGSNERKYLYNKNLYNSSSNLVIFDPTHCVFHNVTSSCQIFEKIVEVLRNALEILGKVKEEVVSHFNGVLDQSKAVSVSEEVAGKIDELLEEKLNKEDKRVLDVLLGVKPVGSQTN